MRDRAATGQDSTGVRRSRRTRRGTVGGGRPRALVALVAAALLAAAVVWAQSPEPSSAAPTAAATTSSIDGSPLNVFADERGRLQARFDGTDTGEFFPPSSNPGNAGLNVRVYESEGSTLYGYLGTDMTPTEPTTVESGEGGYLMTTGYAAGPLQITQFVNYHAGASDFEVAYAIKNTGEGAVRFRASASADLYPSTDSGIGFRESGIEGEELTVGARDGQVVGASGALQEMSQWSAHEEGHFSTINSRVRSGDGFQNTIVEEDLDAGVGAQWDDYRLEGLAGGTSTTFRVRWVFSEELTLATTRPATQPQGNVQDILVTGRTGGGAPDAGTVARYTVTGANPASGTATLDEAGRATFRLQGHKAGTDVASVYLDRDGDGTRDADEPARAIGMHWSATGQQSALVPPAPPVTAADSGLPVVLPSTLPPPILAATVNVHILRGTIYVRLPGTRNFILLTHDTQLPMDTEIDTRRGAVQLQTSNGRGGVHVGEFYDGVFRFGRHRGDGSLLTLRLTGPGPQGKKRQPVARRGAQSSKRKRARPRPRRLWGRAKGRFRSKGNHSAATVRGTRWMIEDRCEGTLTRVNEGSVSVRDYSHKKTVILRTGGRSRHLARAPRSQRC